MELIKKFPKEEKFSLTDEMKRASRSTTHKIAEGLAGSISRKMFNFAGIVEVLYMNSLINSLPRTMKDI